MQLSLEQRSNTGSKARPTLVLQCTHAEQQRLLNYVKGLPRKPTEQPHTLLNLGNAERLRVVIDFVERYGDEAARRKVSALRRHADITSGVAGFQIESDEKRGT